MNLKKNYQYLKKKIILVIEDKKKRKKSDNNKKIIEEKIEGYINFDEAEKIEITKLKLEKNEELNKKIMKDFIKIKNEDYPKVSFKGKTFGEISIEINDLKDLLFTMKKKLELIQNGIFENMELEETKNKFKKDSDNLNHYFDVKNNKKADFTKIIGIKSEFEKYILSINKDFNIFSDEFHKNLGNIPINISNKLNKIFINNFDMPLLHEVNIIDIDYNNLNADSALLSMPTISKKDGILRCNYKKITFQKGPFCPELYSKPIILNILSLVDENISAEIEEFPDIIEEKNEDEKQIEENKNDINNKNEEKKKKKKKNKEKENEEKEDENEEKENEEKEDENEDKNQNERNKNNLKNKNKIEEKPFEIKNHFKSKT